MATIPMKQLVLNTNLDDNWGFETREGKEGDVENGVDGRPSQSKEQKEGGQEDREKLEVKDEIPSLGSTSGG